MKAYGHQPCSCYSENAFDIAWPRLGAQIGVCIPTMLFQQDKLMAVFVLVSQALPICSCDVDNISVPQYNTITMLFLQYIYLIFCFLQAKMCRYIMSPDFVYSLL